MIGIFGYPEDDGNPDADWEILTKGEDAHPYSSGQISKNGAIVIFSSNPKDSETPEQAESYKIDALGWKESESAGWPLVKEKEPILASEEGMSLHRKKNTEGNYIDTDDNSQDFEILEYLSATNQKGQIIDVMPPEPITDLEIDTASSVYNTAVLSWIAPKDPDTLPKPDALFQEDLFYDIRYFRNQELSEENWDQALQIDNEPITAIAGESQTFTISDLYYDSIYYFGVKTCDNKQNCSLISNIVSHSILPDNSPWPMYQHDSRHSNKGVSIGPVAENLNSRLLIQSAGKNDSFSPSVVDENGAIYFQGQLNNKAGLFAFSPKGEEKWFYSTESRGIPAIGKDGTIYIFGQYGLGAFSPKGEFKWKEEPQGFQEFYSESPLIYNNVLYFTANINGDPYLVGVKDQGNQPEQALFYNIKADNEGVIDIPTSFAIDNNNIYLSYHNKLIVLSLSGSKMSERAFEVSYSEDYPGQDRNLIANPSNLFIGEDGTIYLLVKQEQGFVEHGPKNRSRSCLHAINPETLEDKWKICNEEPYLPLAIGSEELYLFIGSGEYPYLYRNFYAVDLSSGCIKWRKAWSYNHKANSFPIIDASNKVYFTYGNQLYGYDPAQVLSSQIEDGRVLYIPAIGADNRLSLGKDGALYVSGRYNEEAKFYVFQLTDK